MIRYTYSEQEYYMMWKMFNEHKITIETWANYCEDYLTYILKNS